MHTHTQEEQHRKLEEEARLRAEAAAKEKIRLKQEQEAAKVAKEKALEDAKIKAEAEDAFAIIGDLDNALKAFQGALGLDVSGCRELGVVTCTLRAKGIILGSSASE